MRTECLCKILFTSWCLGSEWRSKQTLGKWFSMWIGSCLNGSPHSLTLSFTVCHPVVCTWSVSVSSVLSLMLWKCCYLGHSFCSHHKPLPPEVHQLLPVQTRGLRSMSSNRGNCLPVCRGLSWDTEWLSPDTSRVTYLLNTQLMRLVFQIIILKESSINQKDPNNGQVNMQMSAHRHIKYILVPQMLQCFP